MCVMGLAVAGRLPPAAAAAAPAAGVPGRGSAEVRWAASGLTGGNLGVLSRTPTSRPLRHRCMRHRVGRVDYRGLGQEHKTQHPAY